MKILVMWHPHLFITTTIFMVGLLEICNVIMAIVFGNIILGHCLWQCNFELCNLFLKPCKGMCFMITSMFQVCLSMMHQITSGALCGALSQYFCAHG